MVEEVRAVEARAADTGARVARVVAVAVMEAVVRGRAMAVRAEAVVARAAVVVARAVARAAAAVMVVNDRRVAARRSGRLPASSAEPGAAAARARALRIETMGVRRRPLVSRERRLPKMLPELTPEAHKVLHGPLVEVRVALQVGGHHRTRSRRLVRALVRDLVRHA